MSALTQKEIDDLNVAIPALSVPSQIEEGKFPVRGLGDLLGDLSKSGGGDWVHVTTTRIPSGGFSPGFYLDIKTASRQKRRMYVTFSGSFWDKDAPTQNIDSHIIVPIPGGGPKGTILFSRLDPSGIGNYFILETDDNGEFSGSVDRGEAFQYSVSFKIKKFPGGGLLDGDAFDWTFEGRV